MMRSHTFNSMGFAVLAFICSATPALAQAPSSAKDCQGALAKDYYSYAERSSLLLDFLKSIDAETWEQVKHDNSFNSSWLGPYGNFSMSDDYKDFNEKRNKYLETENYHRSEQDAKSIISITTSDRAYSAYEACLRTIGTGPAILALPDRETMDEIDLKIKYVNGRNDPGTKLEGIVEGGRVDGAPSGRLWRGQISSGVNREIPVRIKRTEGTSETFITISSTNGTVESFTYSRADAELTLKYTGPVEIFRQNVRTAKRTPNNDHNTGGPCDNEVGRENNVCVSRTELKLTVTPPLFLREAIVSCDGPDLPPEI